MQEEDLACASVPEVRAAEEEAAAVIFGFATIPPGVAEDDRFLEQEGFAPWEFWVLNFRDLR